MSLWYTNSGHIALCDSGYIAEQDDCPCGCPSFDGRVIAYVDKHATGDNDGTSPENAYTDIQDAIDNDPKKEIQIQGHGEGDAYPDGVILTDCNYLKGIGSVWLDGDSISSVGITGANECRLDSINVQNFTGAGIISLSGEIEGCTCKNNTVGIQQCNNTIILDCFFNDNASFGAANNGEIAETTFTNCQFNNNGNRGAESDNAIFLNCSFSNNDSDGAGLVNNIIGCTSSGNGNYGFFRCGGFFSGGQLTSSTANDNQNCGFIQCVNITSATDSNNCLSGDFSCTPGEPSFNCDEV